MTLTAPTVKERQLKAEIAKRYLTWTRVKDRLRKQGMTIQGIRKLEVEYNIEMDWYHPHFHIVIQGKIQAQLLRDFWLDEYKTADIKGNHITEVGTTAKDLMEVFKYATKDIVKDETTAKATHHIYSVLKGRRVFQTYGKLRKVKQPKKETIERIKYDWLKPSYEIYYYNQGLMDYETTYGVTLIGTRDIAIKIKEHDKQTSNKRDKGLSILSEGTNQEQQSDYVLKREGV